MALREITAQSHQFRSADNLFVIIYQNLRRASTMSDNARLSFVFIQRQAVRFYGKSLV